MGAKEGGGAGGGVDRGAQRISVQEKYSHYKLAVTLTLSEVIRRDYNLYICH